MCAQARRGHDVHLEWSPVILLKMVKNGVERESMREAQALDGAAMSELLSFLEEQVIADAMWTESRVADRVDTFRRPQVRAGRQSYSYLFNPKATF